MSPDVSVARLPPSCSYRDSGGFMPFDASDFIRTARKLVAENDRGHDKRPAQPSEDED